MPIHQYHILTVGGQALWAEDIARISTVEADYLEPSGIYLRNKPFVKENMIFCEVCTTKTNMKDFYTWNELLVEDTETFCWRTFYTFGSTEANWLPISNDFKCLGTCQDLFETIRNAHA